GGWTLREGGVGLITGGPIAAAGRATGGATGCTACAGGGNSPGSGGGHRRGLGLRRGGGVLWGRGETPLSMHQPQAGVRAPSARRACSGTRIEVSLATACSSA